MEKVKRRINNVWQEITIYTKEEAEKLQLPTKYWKEAKPGEWGVTDDGYVGECIKSKEYVDKWNVKKTLKTFTFGRAWVTPAAVIHYVQRKDTGSYSRLSPVDWRVAERKKLRLKHAVRVYVAMMLQGKVDWKVVGRVYRPDQLIPAATVRRAFRTVGVDEMITKEVKAQLKSETGIDEAAVVKKCLEAFDVAKEKKDVSGMYEGVDRLAKWLNMDEESKESDNNNGLFLQQNNFLEGGQEFTPVVLPEAKYNLVDDSRGTNLGGVLNEGSGKTQ